LQYTSHNLTTAVTLMSRALVLALDSGSQSSRAVLFNAGGDILAIGRSEHAPMRHPEPGAVEQDPADIRDSVFAAIRACLQNWGGDPTTIAGAALTTQRTTVLPADRDGAPLRDAVSWLDRRTARADSEPSAPLRLALETLGERSLIPRLLARSWPRQWRDREPEILEQIRWVAPIEAWLHHELCGRVAMAPGGASGPWPYDVKKRAWSRSRRLTGALGFEARWLPELVESGDELGRLTGDAAKACGLPEGLPFFACGGDKQAEALGAGARVDRDDVAAVSLGTGSSIALPSRVPVASLRYHWLTMASAEPGSWHLEYLVFRGMWTVRWFARQFARDLEPIAAASGRPVEALLCDEAAAVPAGSDGMMTWPRWSPTLQHPDETGVGLGFRETHTRGHFFRSLLEGIAFDLKRGLQVLERATGRRIAELRVGGGGTRSDVVVQILADVLGLPVQNPPSEELAARGAAIVAAVGARLHPGYDAAVAAMVPEAPIVQPGAEAVRLYQRLFDEVYVPGLKRWRPLSAALRRVVDAVRS
jgi:sugar (pentulose or hexulose) kinase